MILTGHIRSLPTRCWSLNKASGRGAGMNMAGGRSHISVNGQETACSNRQVACITGVSSTHGSKELSLAALWHFCMAASGCEKRNSTRDFTARSGRHGTTMRLGRLLKPQHGGMGFLPVCYLRCEIMPFLVPLRHQRRKGLAAVLARDLQVVDLRSCLPRPPSMLFVAKLTVPPAGRYGLRVPRC